MKLEKRLSARAIAAAALLFVCHLSITERAYAQDAKAAEAAILKTPMMKSLKLDKLAEDGAWFTTKLGTKKTPAVIFNTGTAAVPTWNVAIYPKSIKLGGIYKTGGGAMLGGIALTNPAVVLSEKASAVIFKDLPKPVQAGIKKVFGTAIKSTSKITYPAGVNFSFTVDMKKSVGLNLLRSTLGVVDTKAAMAGQMGMDFIRYLANGRAATTAGDLDKVSLTTWLKAIKPPKISSYVNAKNMVAKFTGDAKGNITLGGRTTMNVKVGKSTLAFKTAMVFEPKARGADQSLISMTGSVVKMPSSFGGYRVKKLDLSARLSGEKKLEFGFNGELLLKNKPTTFEADLSFAKLPPQLALSVSGDLTVDDVLGVKVPGIGGLAFKNARFNNGFVSGTVEFRGVETTAVVARSGNKKPVLALLHKKFDADAYLPMVAGTPLDQAEIRDTAIIIVPRGSALKAASAKDLGGPIEEYIVAALGSSAKFQLSEGVNLVGAFQLDKSGFIAKALNFVRVSKTSLPFVGKVSADILLNPKLPAAAAFKGPSTKGFKVSGNIKTRSPRLRDFKVPSMKVFNAPSRGGFKPAVKVGGKVPKGVSLPGAKAFKRPKLAGLSDRAKTILASLDFEFPIPVPKIPGVSKLLSINNPTFHILGAEDTDSGEVVLSTLIAGDLELKLPGKKLKSEGSITLIKGTGKAIGVAITSSSQIGWSKAFGLPFLSLNEIGIDGGIADYGAGKKSLHLNLNSEVKLGSQTIESSTILEIENGKIADIGLSVPGQVDIGKLPGLGKIPGINEFAFSDISISLKAISGAVLWKRLGISAYAAIMQMDGGATAMFRVADLQLGKFLKGVPEPFASLMFPASILTFSTKPLTDLTLADLPDTMQAILSGIVDDPEGKVPVFDGVSLIGALGERDFPAPLRKVARDLGVFDSLSGPLLLSGGINGVFSGLPKIGLYASLPGIKLPKNQPLARIVSVDQTQGEFFIRADIASTVFQLGLASNLTISVPHLDEPKKVDKLTFRGELYASVDLVSPAGSFKIGGVMDGQWRNPFGFNNFAFENPAFVIGVDSEGSAEIGVGGTIEFAARKGQKLTYAADFITNINFTTSLPIPKKLGIRLKGKKLGYVAMAEINDSLLRGVLTGPMASVIVNSLPGSEAKKNVKALQTRLKKESLLDILQLNKIPLPLMQLADVDLYFATPGAIIPGREDTLNGMGMVVAGAFEIALMGNSHRVAEMDTRLTMADGFRVYGALSGMKLGPLKTDKAIFDISAKPFGLPYFKIHTGAKLFGVREELDIEVSKTKLGFFYNKDLGPIKLRFDAKTVGEDLLRVRDFTVTARAQNKTFDVITDEVLPNLGLPKIVLDVVRGSLKGASRVPPLFVDGLSFNGSLVNFLTGKKPITLSIEHKYFGDRMAPAVAQVKPVWKDPLKAIPHVEIARAMTHSFLIFLSKHPIDLPAVDLGVVKLNKVRLALDGTNLLKPKYEIIGKTEFLGAPREVELVIADKSLKLRVVDKTFDKLTTEVLPKLGVPKIVLDIVTKSQPLFVDGFSLEGNSDDFFTGKKPIVMKIEHKYFGDRMEPAVAKVYPVWKDPLKTIPHIEIARAMTKSFVRYLAAHPIKLPDVNLGLIKVEKAKLQGIVDPTGKKEPVFLVGGKSTVLGSSRDVLVSLSDDGYAFALKDRIAGGLYAADLKFASVGGTAQAPDDIRYYGSVSNGFGPWLQKSIGANLNKTSKAVSAGLEYAQRGLTKAIKDVEKSNSNIVKAREVARRDLKLMIKPVELAEDALDSANWWLNKADRSLSWWRNKVRRIGGSWWKRAARKAAQKAEGWAYSFYKRMRGRRDRAATHLKNLRRDIEQQRATINVDWHPKVAFWVVAREVAVKSLSLARLTMAGADELNKGFNDVTSTFINAAAGNDMFEIKKIIVNGRLKKLKTEFFVKADIMGEKDVVARLKINLSDPAETDFRYFTYIFNSLIRGKGINRMAVNMPAPPKLPVATVSQADVVAAIVANARLQAKERARKLEGRKGITEAAFNWGNGKAHVFSTGQYVRYDIKADRADKNYPKSVNSSTWPGLSFKTIDAATNFGNGKAYLFSGNQYIRYDLKADRADKGYPNQINSRSWPGLTFNTIDAAVKMGGKIFFFSGGQYIRYDIKADRADKNYPRPIDSNSWPGVTFDTIDSAVNWGNGKVFFFSGNQYIRFDIRADRADSGYPKLVSSRSWPGLAFKSKAPAATPAPTLGAGQNMRIIGTNKIGNDWGIFAWGGKAWKKMSGNSTKIDAGPNGTAVAADVSGATHYWNGKKWSHFPGKARDVSIAADGTVWKIGTDKIRSDFGIHKWDGKAWKQMPGNSSKIDAGPNGTAIAADTGGATHYWNGVKWSTLPGKAREVSISSDGTIWKIGTDKIRSDFGIHKWDGKAWKQMPGNSSKIEAGPNGTAMAADVSGATHYWTSKKWIHLPGKAREIGLSPSTNPAPFSCASRTREFDPCWYSARYPDIKRIFGGDLAKVTNHWNTFGIKEGRDSSATFSLRAYLARYPDLQKVFGANYRALWNHWSSNGKREGRNPAP